MTRKLRCFKINKAASFNENEEPGNLIPGVPENEDHLEDMALKKLLMLGLLGLSCSFVAGAVPIDCATLANNLQALLTNQGLNGACYTKDVYFSNFSYNPGASPIGAADVNANLTSAVVGGTIQTGWNFGPDNAAGGFWNNAITIGFSVTLCDVAHCGAAPAQVPPPLMFFRAALVQEFAFNGTGVPNMTNDFVGNSSTLHLPTSNTSNALLTNSGIFGSPNTSINSVLSSSDGGGLISIQDLVIQSAPEPGTMILFGGGLVIAALNLKKFTRKRQ